jgi:hypothetical protein
VPAVAALKPALIGVTLIGLAAAARFALRTPVRVASDSAPLSHAVLQTEPLPPASVDSLAGAAAGHDPFRMSRSPAGVRFDPGDALAVPLPMAPPMVSRPQLVLVGVVLGSEPTALIEGLPGADGPRLLRLGERVGGFGLREVTADGAVIAGPDTVWTLRVRTRFQ